MYRSIIYTLLFSVLFIGCSSSLINSNYNISREQKEFIKKLQPMATIELDKANEKTITVLPEAGNNLIFTLHIEDAKNITYVQISENRYLNIKELLIKQKEYFFDKNNKKLLINLYVPYIYLLKGSIEYDLSIGYFTKNKKIEVIKKKFEFRYKPMEETADGHLSFKYIDIQNGDITKMDQINKQHLKEELEILNQNRLSPSYKKLVQKLQEQL